MMSKRKVLSKGRHVKSRLRDLFACQLFGRDRASLSLLFRSSCGGESPPQSRTEKEQVVSWIEEETLVCANGMILKWLHGIIIFFSPRAEKERNSLLLSHLSRQKALIQSQ
jgi:hypothetical protein